MDDWCVVSRVSSEDSPRAVVEDVSVELALTIVESEGGSVDTDDVSNSGDDGEIFESLGVENEGGIVAGITSSLLALNVEALVNNLE